jgi:hypothetical protein
VVETMATSLPHPSVAVTRGTRTESAATDHTARTQPRERGAHPKHFKKALKASCPFHGGQTMHLIKDYATIRGYICGTLGQQGKA